MSKNIGELLNSLAKKAGINEADQTLVGILSNSELTRITIPSDLVKQFDEKLLSIDTALDNHPDVRSKYMAQALNGLDAKIADVAKAAKLSDDVVATLNSEKSSYKRLELLLAEVDKNHKAAIEAAKAEAGKSTDKAALERQNKELLDKLAEKEKEHSVAIESLHSEYKQKALADKINGKVVSILSGYKTVLDALPVESKTTAIQTLINKELQDKQVEFALDESGNFVLRTKDGSTYVSASQTRIEPKDFIEGILANNKILQVSTPPTPPANGGNGNVIVATPEGPQGNNQKAAVSDFNSAQLAAFQ